MKDTSVCGSVTNIVSGDCWGCFIPHCPRHPNSLMMIDRPKKLPPVPSVQPPSSPPKKRKRKMRRGKYIAFKSFTVTILQFYPTVFP